MHPAAVVSPRCDTKSGMLTGSDGTRYYPDRIMKRGQENIPLGCLTIGGREGVILMIQIIHSTDDRVSCPREDIIHGFFP
jgi:hypothetical protein